LKCKTIIEPIKKENWKCAWSKSIFQHGWIGQKKGEKNFQNLSKSCQKIGKKKLSKNCQKVKKVSKKLSHFVKPGKINKKDKGIL
jgi:hypothetical protein